ncbi:MAG: FAD-dependent oxidoreductase [Planctomycetota bacterium]|jgi:glycerol-3-phosphate dehydrogenase
MTAVGCHPDRATAERHDLVIVGGGLVGTCLLLEAARRGLRGVLLERADFGAAVDPHGHRLQTGGLPSLLALDGPRFRVAHAERLWLRRHLPHLLRPVPCLLPLRGGGARRPAVARVAIAVEAARAAGAGLGAMSAASLPRAWMVGADETIVLAPHGRRHGLRGGVAWEADLVDAPARLGMDLLREAARLGGLALNRVEAVDLRADAGAVTGVDALDRRTGRRLALRAPIVINAAGRLAPALAARWDRPLPHLFRPGLAFTLLLDHPAPVRHAVVLPPSRRHAPPCVVLPWRGGLLAGPFHVAWRDAVGDEPAPDEGQLAGALEQLARALPGLAAGPRDVRRVTAELVRIDGDGRPRPGGATVAHGRHGGPAGLISVVAGDPASARPRAARAAALVERRVGRRRPRPATLACRPPDSALDLADPDCLDRVDRATAAAALRGLADDEAAAHLDDLVLRRTGWADDPVRTMALGRRVAALLGWDETRRAAELDRLQEALGPWLPETGGPYGAGVRLSRSSAWRARV